MAGPLKGIRVLDWSTGTGAAITTMVLSDAGAEVLRLDPEGGHPARSHPAFRAWDRGKRSATFDASAPGARARLEALLAESDLFVDDRPNDLAALGLDEGELRSRFPALIHLVITAYGLDGPVRPMYDSLVAARLGLHADRMTGVFRHQGWLAPSYGCASMAIIGAVGALYAREFTGRGQLVETSMMDGALSVFGAFGAWWNEKGLTVFGAPKGTPPGVPANRRLHLKMYECADGLFLQFHTGAPGRFWRTMQLLGLDDRISPSKGLLEMAETLTDEETEIVHSEIPKIMKTRPRDEWLQLFWDADICAQPVLQPEEPFTDAQALHNRLIVNLVDPMLGAVKQIGPPVLFSASPTAIAGPAPLPGEHTREGYGSPRGAITWAERDGRTTALEGIRVLDFGQYIAGPMSTRFLANLGADVIKVEPTVGDTMRPLIGNFENGNWGKRSIALDLKDPEARQALARLIAGADIITHNFRPGAAERLGIGYDDVRSVNPSIIYCAAPGWGSTGPKASHQSFAPITGGTNGLYYGSGGEGNPPTHAGNEDYFNAAIGTGALLMALFHRQRTGEGQYLECAQYNSALYLATHTIMGADGTLRSQFQLDRERMGWGPLDRIYDAADGRIYVVCETPEEFAALGRAIGREDLPADPRFATPAARHENRHALTAILKDVFSGRPAAEWFDLLDDAGVPVERLSDVPVLPALFEDDSQVASGRVVEFQHPQHGRVRELAISVRLSGTPSVARGRSPLLGEHSREILAEAGYSPEQIARLETDRRLVAAGG